MVKRLSYVIYLYHLSEHSFYACYSINHASINHARPSCLHGSASQVILNYLFRVYTYNWKVTVTQGYE